jgi:hypothetical protein
MSFLSLILDIDDDDDDDEDDGPVQSKVKWGTMDNKSSLEKMKT